MKACCSCYKRPLETTSIWSKFNTNIYSYQNLKTTSKAASAKLEHLTS